MWEHMSFQGQRLRYTGKGGELFVGFLLAVLLVSGIALAAGVVSTILQRTVPALAKLPIVMANLMLAVLATGAIFSAQRYRLSRTEWCGIRGGMAGSMVTYGVKTLLYTLIATITFAQMVPWMQMRLAERRINAASFGDAPFAFQGRAMRLYPLFVAALLATFVLCALVVGIVFAIASMADPTLIADIRGSQADPLRGSAALAPLAIGGIVGLLVLIPTVVWAWYNAAFDRHVAGNTTLGNLRLSSTLTGGALARLTLGNTLILILSLGFGYPLVVHRSALVLSRTLMATGSLDPNELGQTSLRGSRYGEGMFQALDAAGAF
jgi:uncharacterized membrane protein YjgN (DUF898 family)